jgi:LuxR family maltose regulon positive regulatory protein
MSMDGAAGRSAFPGTRFAQSKFRPTTLPSTLVTRPTLHDQLTAGADKQLTVVVGSAGAGKSVLLSSWAASRPPDATSWLSCDKADADPVRFWMGFVEAPRSLAPGFGADAADLLAIDAEMSADVTASIANDAARLPAGSAIIVDDFQAAASAVAKTMTDLVERWPADTAQLVLASRSDPPLRLHRLRMSGDLCELRDRDLSFSLEESQNLLANFGVQVGANDLALLHKRSEGWAAVMQMVALTLRGSRDPERAARALDIRSHAIADYFVSEVLEQQPPDVVQFMLDTSVLSELTAGACAAVTDRQDAEALLHEIHAGNLFLVALDDEQTSFRYHHLVRKVLRAELRARDRTRETALQLRAAEWFEAVGDTRRAARHLLAAQQVDRALALVQDRVVPDFLRDPTLPAVLDLGRIVPSKLADAPERLLAIAADLLTWGDTGRGGEYLAQLERARPSIPPESRLAARFAAMRAFRYGLLGQLDEAVDEALAARAIQERTQLKDEWNAVVPLVLLRVYNCTEDFPAIEREAAAALALPDLPESARVMLVPGAQALAWFQAGRLAEAASAARAADAEARRLSFDEHFFAVDHLRVLSGLALERRDLDTAEHLTERTLSITERRRPVFEFTALLDRAGIWAARGRFRDALTTVAVARHVMDSAGPQLLARADELEGLIRLSLGDLTATAELAGGLPAARREILLARIALAAGDHCAALEHLQAPALEDTTPRQALVRRLLLAATAIERGDRSAAGIVAAAVETARQAGFLNTVVTTAPQVTTYLIEHGPGSWPDPFVDQLVGAALDARATQVIVTRRGHGFAEPLTAAELRILKLLPTSTYLQMASTLYISRNTVKTHLRSVYQKLGVASRAEAIERAVDLRLL